MDSDRFGAGLRLSQCEPDDWFVVFHADNPNRWVRWLALGRFKHVSVFGKVARANAWVFFDYQMDRSRIFVVGEHEADILIGNYASGTTVVRMARQIVPSLNMALSIGGWCVPAVAHLLGLRGCALRPDALFRQCLAHGGEVICSEGMDDEAKGQGRSRTEAPAGGCAAGEDQHDSGQAIV